MKPTLSEWIPLFGMFKYSKRFNEYKNKLHSFADIRYHCNLASWFEVYHITTSIILFIVIYLSLLSICLLTLS